MAELAELILVVDDEASLREFLQRVLKGAGHSVITAADGDQALELVRQKAPELVLLDIKMPGKSGTEVLRELKIRYPDTAVIMVTGVRDVNVAMDTMREGAYDYLTKPFNVSELVICVARALERQKLLREKRDYQLNLERKVAEQTQLLEQKIRELTALNNLFITYLNQGFEAAEVYGQLAISIAREAEQIQALAKEAEAKRVQVQNPPEA